MERQLKERLIGAAVLVAVAVIMVPEMFSGPHPHSDAVVDASNINSGQIKTYQIELQSAHSAQVAPTPDVQEPIAQPAPQPKGGAREETAALPDRNIVQAASSSAGSVASVSSSSVSATLPRAADASSIVAPKSVAKPKPDTETPSKLATANKPADGEWVVQVGSFGTEDKARQIVATLKSQGHAASLSKIAVGGRTLYRVRVGMMPSRAAAETTLKKINNTYPGASVVPANR